jgi:hypothetical protein
LGKWISPPHLKWQWFYWQHHQQLFHWVNDVWHHCVPFLDQSTVAYKRIGIVATLPTLVEELQRATVHFDQGQVLFEGSETHHRSAIFYPHKILFEIHRVFGFFCFRMLIFTDLIQSPIIFFGDVTSQIQDWLQIFQVGHPRFSVVPLNEKMCSSPPEGGLVFF